MKKVYQILFVSLIVLTVIILSSFIVIPILESRIEAQLTQMLDEEFPDAEFRIKDINVHLLTGDFLIDEFRIRDKTKNINSIEFKGLFINNISWYKLLKYNRLNAHHVRIDNIDVDINNSNANTFHYLQGDSLKEILNIQELTVKGFNFVLRDTIQNVSLGLYNGDLRLSFKSMAPDIIDGHFYLDSLYLKDKEGDYVYESGSINMQIGERTMTAQRFKITPQHGRRTFSERKGRHVLRYELNIPTIQFMGFNIRELILDKAILADRVQINKMRFNAFENPDLPIDKSRHKLLPQEYLRKLKYRIEIDTIQLRSSHIQYATMNSRTKEVGTIDFEKTYISMYNLTNDSIQKMKNPYMTVDFMSQFMGTGKLTGTMSFDLLYENSPYTVRFHLGKMDVTDVETLTVPVLNFGITGGHNVGMGVNISADDKQLSGVMEFSYKNLELDFFDKEEGSSRILLSWLVNRLFIKKMNIKGEKGFRTGSISYERQAHKSFFGNLWKALEMGIATTVFGKKNTELLQKLGGEKTRHLDEEGLEIDSLIHVFGDSTIQELKDSVPERIEDWDK